MRLSLIINVLTVLLLFWGCPGPSTPEDILPIQDVRFTYLQEQNKLYFAAYLERSYDGGRLDSVRVAWYGTDSTSTPDILSLNDSGKVGDIIRDDDVYSLKVLNNSFHLSNVVGISDTGKVYVEYIAYYQSEIVTEVDSFFLGNIRPRILEISAIDSVVRPSDTSVLFELVTAAAYDANGLEDIRWVGFTSYHVEGDSFVNKGKPIYLYDDGSEIILYEPNFTSGDLVKGDGIFSFKVPIYGSGNTDPEYQTKPGHFNWIFDAQDFHNAYSDTVIHRIVVQ